jgi:hypothetical protein
VVAAVCLGVLVAPMAASATTGTATDKRAIVTITDKGATWNPTPQKLGVTTGVTVRIDVVNRASQKHWFQVGNRRTATLGSGQSYEFFYLFDTPGDVQWHVGLGDVSGGSFNGVVVVHFPKFFD